MEAEGDPGSRTRTRKFRRGRSASVLKEPNDYHISERTVWRRANDEQVVISRHTDELGWPAGASDHQRWHSAGEVTGDQVPVHQPTHKNTPIHPQWNKTQATRLLTTCKKNPQTVNNPVLHHGNSQFTHSRLVSSRHVFSCTDCRSCWSTGAWTPIITQRNSGLDFGL